MTTSGVPSTTLDRSGNGLGWVAHFLIFCVFGPPWTLPAAQTPPTALGDPAGTPAILIYGFAVLAALGLASTALLWFQNQKLRRSLAQEYQSHEELTERFAMAVDSSLNTVLFVDDTGRITYANAHAEAALGYTPAELKGQLVELLVPERFHGQHVEDRQAFMTDPHARPMGEGRDLFAVRKDGTEIPVEIGLNPMQSDGKTLIVATIVDITLRRQSEERLELALYGTSEGVWDWDIQTGAIWCSPRLLALLDYAPQSFPGNLGVLESHLHPDDRDYVMEAIQAHVDSDTPFDCECRLMTSDGEYRWVRMRGAARRSESGVAERMAGAIQDITEQKVADQNLKDYAERLQRLNDALAARNRELDEFSYVASHDLQEPLRKLITFSELLREDLPGELPEEAAADLDTITSAARRMQRLVQDLLTLSRSGQRGMERRKVSLDACVDDALEALEMRIQESNAAITRQPLPQVWGDRTLLTQLFQNLIGNALKFHGDAPPRIEITHDSLQNQDIFGVRDAGIGIEPALAEQVFAPFKRLHPLHIYEGSGIGLAVCRKIVNRHGGRIWVESELGHGAHFRFTLQERQSQGAKG